MDLVKDEIFTSIFWRLSSDNDARREAAVLELLTYIENLQEADGPIYRKYTLERLVKGLRSVRNLARLGFATALTSLLIRFANHVEQDELLKVIKKHLYDVKVETKGEGTSLRIGQLYLISALQKANCFNKCVTTDVKWLMDPIYRLLEKGDYRPLAFYTINSVLSQVSTEIFEEALLPSLSTYLSAGWEKTDPNEFLLLVTASKEHSSVIGKKWLAEHWRGKHLFSSSNHTFILNLMEQSFEGRERALKTPHPMVGSVINSIKGDFDKLSSIWKLAVEQASQKQSEKGNKSVKSKAVLLQLFFEIIQICQESQKFEVLSPYQEAALLFHKQLTKTELALYPMASHFVQSQLPRWCEKVDNECQAALFSILTSADPTFDYGLIPGLRVAQVLMGKVADADRLMAYAEALCQAYEDKDIKLGKRAYIANQLRLLIVSGECLPPKYILSILVFMMDRVLENPKQGDPMVSSFYKCLDWLSSAPKKLIKASHYFRRIMRPLLKHGIEKASEDGCKASKVVVTAMGNAVTLLQKKGEDKESVDDHMKQMFALLYAHLGLHSLADDRGMETLLNDVDQCYEKATSTDSASTRNVKTKKKENEEDDEEKDQPQWTEVMTDCLLSLLSHSSRLLRGLVRLIFSRMVDHLTPMCSQLLADVLMSRVKQKQKKNLQVEDEDDDLLDFDNDVEELDDDDVEADGSDEENEPEKMDVEEEKDAEEDGDEDDDDDDDDEDDIEDEEDEDAAEIAALRHRMQSALGAAALSTEVSDDSDMDDDAMFRLDKAIAAAFKAASKSCCKQAMEQRRQQLVQLKSRCLDLVEILLQQSEKVTVILPCVAACIQVLGRPDEGEVKVAEAMAVIKKRQSPLIAKPEEVKVVYAAIVEHIQSANKAQPLPRFLSVLASVILILLKSLPESSQTKLIKEELRKFIEDNSPLSQTLLAILFERNPLLGWHVKEDLLAWARQNDLRLFNRSQAVILLCTVLKFTTTIENQAAFRASCLATADHMLKDADVWTHPHLARQILELAFISLKGEKVDKAVTTSLHQTVTEQLTSKNVGNKTIKRGVRRLQAALEMSERRSRENNPNVKKKKRNRKRKHSKTK